MSAIGGAAGNLPADTTSFIGRRREITEVRRLVAASRLVTLVGVGGVGKTRLAIEVARRMHGDFVDGVWLVDLAPLASGAELAQTVVSTIDVVDRSARDPVEKLVEHLAQRRSLLLMDNCEHLLDDCSPLVHRLLRSAAGLRVLATSRRGFEIAGEHLYEVAPLRQDDAVNLLVERATARDPHFTLSDENQLVVAKLCAQLDGIPLAIELAATRLRSLAPETLLERLGDRFALLTAGSRAALPRQQTLRALIDWSYGLCSTRERLLWEQLSVFVGSFDLETAEGVCSLPDLPTGEIVNALDGLVAQSIVISEDRRSGRRYRMLETIRQYGLQRLGDSGREPALRRRYRDFYLERARRTADSWSGPRQEACLALLRDDHDNLRAAFELSVAEGDAGTALELVAALRHHWYADVFLSEGRRWLDHALSLPDGDQGPRARALWVAAWVSLLQGDRDVAGARLSECEAIGDHTSAAFATSLRGTAALFAGDLPASIDYFERGMEALRQEDSTEGVLAASFQLATSLAHAGELERAIEVCERAVAISEQCGESWGRSCLLWTWGYAAWLQGDAGSAGELTHAALSLQRRVCDPVAVALMIELLAWVAASESEFAQSARLLALADWIWRRVGTGIAAFGPHHAAHHERCAEQIGTAREQVELSEGLSVARVIELALGEEEHVPAAVPEPDAALTPREWEVARLVARGMTNREIAQSLVVSPRTVDGHVEHILAKLGFRSRAQVAAWVAERGSTATA